MNTHELEALDKELAELLGWTNIAEGKFPGDYMRFVGQPNGIWPRQYIPRWTQNDGAAFRLAVEHDVFPEFWKGQVWIGNGDDKHFVCEDPANFTDKISAFRVAIVKAVIQKLKF